MHDRTAYGRERIYQARPQRDQIETKALSKAPRVNLAPPKRFG